MLEDDYTQVIRKAMVGMGQSEDVWMSRLGVSSDAWAKFMAGEFDEALAARFAEVLGLRVEALVGHPRYHPRVVDMPSIRRLELPFASYGVNAWWVEHEGARVVFDAGAGSNDLMDVLPSLPDLVCITHGHRDHVGAVPALRAAGVKLVMPGDGLMREPWACGRLVIRAMDLSGHCVPALGYRIDGLTTPVLVVGDALFAGSMGKVADPAHYQLALQTLRAAMAGMPDETVLLPGHGSATTLGEERVANPFL